MAENRAGITTQELTRHRTSSLTARAALAAALIVGGTLLAAYVQTGGGAVYVQDVRFVGAGGQTLSALLYSPDAATADAPAPGVLAIHGYINSRETQSGFAIELSRRGFVVLASDQTGHGYSDPPAFSAGFGGPDALAYLRSLAFVDASRIGLEGHSMGGWAVQVAAAAHPRGYVSMVLEGSSTGTFGAPAGTSQTPRNLAVVFSRYDEFSELMWGSPVAADIVRTEKLKALFGTDEAVEIGRTYGDPAKGTARRLAMPPVTHPGAHLSTEAIGEAVTWLESTLGHHSGIPASDQVWYWKELGTLLALIGLSLLIFPLTEWLLRSGRFQAAITGPATPLDHKPGVLALNAVMIALIPVLTFYPLQILGDVILPANPLLPQQITNGVLVWAWGTSLISLSWLVIWMRRGGFGLADLGMPRAGAVVKSAALLAATCGAFLYVVVLAADFFLNVDFRFWVVALKAMAAHQVPAFLIYLPLFGVFFLALSLSLHSQVRSGGSLRSKMLLAGASLSAGFVVLLAVQYLPLLTGGTLALASQPLLTIVAFQFVPLLFLAGLISTYCFTRTGNIYTGAFINSVVVTWYMVAGTATQATPFWW